jgi:hypothetical protein
VRQRLCRKPVAERCRGRLVERHAARKSRIV